MKCIESASASHRGARVATLSLDLSELHGGSAAKGNQLHGALSECRQQR